MLDVPPHVNEVLHSPQNRTPFSRDVTPIVCAGTHEFTEDSQSPSKTLAAVPDGTAVQIPSSVAPSSETQTANENPVPP